MICCGRACPVAAPSLAFSDGQISRPLELVPSAFARAPSTAGCADGLGGEWVGGGYHDDGLQSRTDDDVDIVRGVGAGTGARRRVGLLGTPFVVGGRETAGVKSDCRGPELQTVDVEVNGRLGRTGAMGAPLRPLPGAGGWPVVGRAGLLPVVDKQLLWDL